MHESGVVISQHRRADSDVATRLGALGCGATVHEAMGAGRLDEALPAADLRRRADLGTAVTVLLHPGDNWMLHVAAEQIRPGDLVVAAITADCTDGYFGDLLATSFKARGARDSSSTPACATWLSSPR